jgi:hypothetical protein
VPLGEHVEVLIGTRHERRHGPVLQGDLVDGHALVEDVARAEPFAVAAVDEAAELIEARARLYAHPVVRGAHERLIEIQRVVDGGHDGHVVAVPQKVFGHARAVGVRNAVAAHEAGLQVRRLDDELVTFPSARREAFVRVARVLRWMRTAVHPERAREPVAAVAVVRHEPLRDRVVFLDERQAAGAAVLIRRRMRQALVLGNREPRRRVQRRLVAQRIVDRQTRIVAEIGAAAAIDEFLLKAEDAAARVVPVAADVDLRARRRRAECCQGHGRGDAEFSLHR